MFAGVRERLSVGVTTESPFDARSAPTYVILAFSLVSGFVLMFVSGVRFDPLLATTVLGWAVWLVVAAWLLRRVSHGEIATILESATLLYAQGLALMGVIYSVAVLSGPFTDDWLDAADASFGFDWLTFCRTIGSAPWPVLRALKFAYWSFQWQPIPVVIALAYCKLDTRIWRLVFASAFSAVMTAVVFAFFPAEGAFRHAHVAFAEVSRLATVNAWRFGDVIHTIRDGHLTYIDAHLISGIISFPSYHTVGAVLFAWAMWPVKWLRWPFTLLNTAMVLAAIPLGAHYLVDIIAGMLVAGTSLTLAYRLVADRAHVDTESHSARIAIQI